MKVLALNKVYILKDGDNKHIYVKYAKCWRRKKQGAWVEDHWGGSGSGDAISLRGARETQTFYVSFEQRPEGSKGGGI